MAFGKTQVDLALFFMSLHYLFLVGLPTQVLAPSAVVGTESLWGLHRQPGARHESYGVTCAHNSHLKEEKKSMVFEVFIPPVHLYYRHGIYLH